MSEQTMPDYEGGLIALTQISKAASSECEGQAIICIWICHNGCGICTYLLKDDEAPEEYTNLMFDCTNCHTPPRRYFTFYPVEPERVNDKLTVTINFHRFVWHVAEKKVGIQLPWEKDLDGERVVCNNCHTEVTSISEILTRVNAQRYSLIRGLKIIEEYSGTGNDPRDADLHS
ncbi:hypothetical protein VMCG_06772 [Cytospora schulzeri]|uniref:Uncharacterized protein n=1 Tax=Cytospora schulzeri TaxID=448051 RepID=A0A423W5N7_9PEZI|nr:hypothetical protein VMCG_06772 [Valsa malicola]